MITVCLEDSVDAQAARVDAATLTVLLRCSPWWEYCGSIVVNGRVAIDVVVAAVGAMGWDEKTRLAASAIRASVDWRSSDGMSDDDMVSLSIAMLWLCCCCVDGPAVDWLSSLFDGLWKESE